MRGVVFTGVSSLLNKRFVVLKDLLLNVNAAIIIFAVFYRCILSLYFITVELEQSHGCIG